jgi:hypothetical protein
MERKFDCCAQHALFISEWESRGASQHPEVDLGSRLNLNQSHYSNKMSFLVGSLQSIFGLAKSPVLCRGGSCQFPEIACEYAQVDVENNIKKPADNFIVLRTCFQSGCRLGRQQRELEVRPRIIEALLVDDWE